MAYRGFKVGLGIVTYDRPQRLQVTLSSAWGRLTGVVDSWVVYEDGSPSPAARRGYNDVAVRFQEVPFIRGSTNHGVAYAKNRCFERLLEAECDWIFISEDDMEIVSEAAVTGYIDACVRSGLEHLSFAKHGLCNQSQGMMYRRDDGIEVWPCSVGAWAVYSRRSLEDVGLMDEWYVNVLEHVNHTWKLAEAGYTTPMWHFADAEGSGDWLREQPDAAATTTFKAEAFADRERRTAEAKRHWNETDGLFWT